MDPEPIVFDISSDEESSGCREEPKGDDFDWLAEFLGVGDDKPSDQDSDEVVVLREVKPTGKSKSSKPMVRVEDDEDDDCVVLDGDPDNPVADEDSNSTSGGSDDLLIVGEKGQIACRDFPHSRHLCARFPFSTTAHEKHCNLCHCYVCDSPAPCAFWATWSSSIDHCHATDKEETWRAQRRNLKSGKTATLPASKLSETMRPVGLPQLGVSPLNTIRLSPNSRPQNHVSRPATIQGCSSTNISVPTILSRSRSPQPGLGFPRTKFQPRMVSGRQFPGVSHNIRRGRGGLPIGNSGHGLVPPPPPPTMFKRPGTAGVSLPMVQKSYYSSNSRNCAVVGQYARTPTPAPVLNNLNTIRWENVNSSANQSSSGPNVGTGALSTPHSQQPFYNQSIPPSNNRQNLDQHGNQFQSNGQSIDRHENETQNSGQNLCPGGIKSSSATVASSVGYDPSLVITACQSNQRQQPPIENSQLQGTDPANEPLVKESDSQFSIRNINLSSNYGFDDWFLDEPSVPVVSDGSVPTGPNNIFSPEPTPIDAGLLIFDFETSWNSLTHA